MLIFKLMRNYLKKNDSLINKNNNKPKLKNRFIGRDLSISSVYCYLKSDVQQWTSHENDRNVKHVFTFRLDLFTKK